MPAESRVSLSSLPRDTRSLTFIVQAKLDATVSQRFTENANSFGGSIIKAVSAGLAS